MSSCCSAVETTPERFEFEETRMGVPVRVILYLNDKVLAQRLAGKVFERFQVLNDIMSDYDSDSELSKLAHRSDDAFAQRTGPIWIPVSDDLFVVLRAARLYGEMSDGAFDITISPLVRLWRRSRRQHELPSPKLLDRARKLVGLPLWELDEQKRAVRLLKPGMKLDLGGIAKGYAIDQAFELISREGISVCLIDAGGDFRVGDAPPGGWKLDFGGQVVSFSGKMALATSGPTHQFVEIDGVRYSHIIDPKTGLGLTGPAIVHVAAPTAMEADALASAVSVLGPEKGLKLIETRPNVSAKVVSVDIGKEEKSERWSFDPVELRRRP